MTKASHVTELLGRLVLAIANARELVDGLVMFVGDWIATSIWVFREQHPHATLAIQALVGLVEVAL